MAKAFKCDRCKKFYDENKKYIRSGNTLTGLTLDSKTTHSGSQFDFCESCLDDLFGFLHIESEKESIHVK